MGFEPGPLVSSIIVSVKSSFWVSLTHLLPNRSRRCHDDEDHSCICQQDSCYDSYDPKISAFVAFVSPVISDWWKSFVLDVIFKVLVKLIKFRYQVLIYIIYIILNIIYYIYIYYIIYEYIDIIYDRYLKNDTKNETFARIRISLSGPYTTKLYIELQSFALSIIIELIYNYRAYRCLQSIGIRVWKFTTSTWNSVFSWFSCIAFSTCEQVLVVEFQSMRKSIAICDPEALITNVRHSYNQKQRQLRTRQYETALLY